MEWARKKQRCYFLGMGDYDDFLSSSERLVMGHGNLHDSTIETIEEFQLRLVDRMYKEISFMQGRIVGLLEGNHYGDFQDGTTTTQKLCQKLGCAYLGANSFIRLIFEERNGKRGKGICKDIFAHHGLGSSRLGGSSLNRVENMQMVAKADVYLMGHDHRKSIGMASILQLTDNHRGDAYLEDNEVLFARTGSFLRGYVPNAKSYVVDAGLRPTDLGTVKIEFTPRRTAKVLPGGGREDKRRVHIHGSI